MTPASLLASLKSHGTIARLDLRERWRLLVLVILSGSLSLALLIAIRALAGSDTGQDSALSLPEIPFDPQGILRSGTLISPGALQESALADLLTILVSLGWIAV